MNINDINKVLYEEKPIAQLKGILRDGGSREYIAETSLGYIVFFVPIIELKADIDFFKNEMEAQFLMKWLDVERTKQLHDFIKKFVKD